MTRRFAACTFLLSLFALGCGDAEPIDSADLERAFANSVVVRPDYLIARSDLVAAMRRRSADGRLVPLLTAISDYSISSPERAEPVYLVADRADQAVLADGEVDELVGNPFGFARKAVAFRADGDATIIDTEPAALEQVLGDSAIRGRAFLGSSDGAERPGRLGVPAAAQRADGITAAWELPEIDLTGSELLNQDGAELKLGETFLRASADLDYAVDVAEAGLQTAQLVVNGSLDGQLVVEGVVGEDFGTRQVDEELFVTKVALPRAGGVPVTLKLSVRVGCSISAVMPLEGSAGFTLHAEAATGFDYDRSRPERLVGVAQHAIDLEPVLPHFELEGSANLHCYLKPKYEVMFFDRAAPFTEYDAYADLRFSSAPANVDMALGMAGTVGGSARLFSFQLADFALDLFEVTRRGYSGPPGSVCGNGVCEWDEDGQRCAEDCCDASTPCGVNRAGLERLWCRSINGGPYAWTTAEEAEALCDERQEACGGTAVSRYACGGTIGVCGWLDGDHVGWMQGTCP